MSYLHDTVLSGLPRPVTRIVHIGAGPGNDLPAYLASGAAAILMVEADPDAVAELAARAAGQDRVAVIHAAVSARPGPLPFYRTSFAELNALRAPGALLDLFPGLRVLSHHPVVSIPPTDLPLSGSDKDETGHHLLVLETPGEALGILQALEAEDKIALFGTIALGEAPEPVYRDAPALALIRDYLNDRGYDTWVEPDPEKAERPWLIARHDPRARRITELETALAAAGQARAAQETSHAADIARAGETARTLKAEIARSEQALEEVRTRHAAETARTQEANEALKAEITRIQEANQTLKEEIARAREETATLRSECTAARAAQTRVEAQLTETGKRHANAMAEAETRVRTSQVALAEAEQRLDLSRDEALKLEGQLRLLRDVLLSGQST